MARTRVTLYGGLNEIGGNKFLLEEGEDRLLLDFGTSIGARNQYFDGYLGTRNHTILRDLLRLGLLPDLDGVYRQDLLEIARSGVANDLPESAAEHLERTGRPAVHGVLVTHAHVDHFQDISFLDPSIPVYCSATTRAMLEAIDAITRTDSESEVVQAKLRSLGQDGERAAFPGLLNVASTPQARTLRACPEGSMFRVGPFHVTAVPVDHSVPGAVAFLVRTPSGKRVFYTGDVRFNGGLHARTEALREATRGLAPDLLLTEGTRIRSTDADNEAGVQRDVQRLVAECRGLAIVEFGWKDTTRFDTVQRVAAASGRTLVVSPKLAYLLKALDHLDDVPSRSLSHYDDVAVYVKRRRSMMYHPNDYASNKYETGYDASWSATDIGKAWKARDLVTLRDPLAHFASGLRASDIRRHPERYLLHLSYFEVNELFDLAPPAGSRWVRCMTEPYSDEMTMDLDRQKRWMHQFGLEHNVRTDTEREVDLNGTLEGTTHVSGHAAGSDLLAFLEAMEPVHVVPIHVEAEGLHHYDAIGKERTTFPTFDFHDAAKGRAVVEL